MRVLVACEYSGTVRDAFLARGHEVMSCDLLPTESPGPHYQGDVRHVLREPRRFFSGPIDLMIAHPDCTYLCRAGQRWLHAPADERPGKLKGLPRYHATWEAVQFFRLLHDAPIERIAVENPRPGSHVVEFIGKPDQVVQPWQFGHGEVKATGLWLENLPPLAPTSVLPVTGSNGEDFREAKVHRASPSADRWKLRSLTYSGLAAAMADQWGSL
jgi:hypothetical protein